MGLPTQRATRRRVISVEMIMLASFIVLACLELDLKLDLELGDR